MLCTHAIGHPIPHPFAVAVFVYLNRFRSLLDATRLSLVILIACIAIQPLSLWLSVHVALTLPLLSLSHTFARSLTLLSTDTRTQSTTCYISHSISYRLVILAFSGDSVFHLICVRIFILLEIFNSEIDLSFIHFQIHFATDSHSYTCYDEHDTNWIYSTYKT